MEPIMAHWAFLVRLYWLFSVLTQFFTQVISADNYKVKSVIMVAGNFTLNGELLNIAQFDPELERWSNMENLYIYGEANGLILDIAVDASNQQVDKLFVAGSFDTERRTSQIQLCSAGGYDGLKYDGLSFTKIGEGLCPKKDASSTARMAIYTAVMGNNGDLFVGGSFESRVWNGDDFVDVFHLARFDANLTSWFPLSVGQLQCISIPGIVSKVNSLAWDALNEVLYLGGVFDAVNYKLTTTGLLLWTKATGLVSFPGGGVGNYINGPSDAFVKAIAYDAGTQSLFVSGSFHYVGTVYCPNIAVWQSNMNRWVCLYSESFGISTVTSMLLSSSHLYLSGWTSPSSTWEGKSWQSPYAVARFDLEGFVQESKLNSSRSRNNSSKTDERRAGPLSNRDVKAERTPLSPSLANRRRYLLERVVRNMSVDARLRQRSRRDGQSNEDRVVDVDTKYGFFQQQPYWTPRWEWLPGFPGGNGPIFRMTEGTGLFSGRIFIAGAFNNYPPVIVWKEAEVRSNRFLDTVEKSGSCISWLARNSSISGLITVVLQANLPFDDSAPPHIPVVPSIDYTFSIFVGCVVIASILGLGFAIGFFHRKGFSASRDSLDINFEDYSESNGMFRGISLLTLTGASATSVSTIQFKECFERAMLARHLPTKETLLIINPKEIVLSKIIGEGSFGRVWSGQWQGKVVAVKEFVFAQAAIVGGSLERSNIIEEIVGEAGIMACLSHSKILQLYGCSLTMQAIWIVSELCIRGSLKMVLSNRSLSLAMTDKLAICMDVADGMHYLHTRSPPIIHRDLKSHNIFITESPSGHLVAKIGDWGSARAIALTGAKSMTQGVGTACWLSPEVINNAHFSMSSDVYAFGIVLWEVFTRQEIYEGLSAAQIIAKVAHEGLRPHIPFDCPWADIMQSCWRQDALDRPTFHHILVKLSSMYDLECTSYSDSSDAAVNASIAPKVILRQKLQAEYLGLAESSYQNPFRSKDLFIDPPSVSSLTPTPPHFPLANFETRKYKADSAFIAKRTSTVSVPEQLNFDVSDLRGPSFFIVADSGNDEDEDDADDHRETSMLMKGGRNPRDESHPRTSRSNPIPAATAAVESFANDRALHSSPSKSRLHSKASGSF